MSTRYQLAIRAARAAGKVLREKFNATREIRSKGKRDIVTDADFAADRALRQVILVRFPRDHFLSEEDDATIRAKLWQAAQSVKDDYLWIADPLDGTTNYAHHIPIFGVSLALFHDNQVQIGAVYDPLLDEMYSAERGRGAFLNGKPIHVSAVDAFDNAVAGTEWARDQRLRRRTASVFGKILGRVMSARALGSAALSLCYIAAGRLDAYFHLSLAPWDVAAAALIVEEAGGKVTAPTGTPWSIHSKAYVATNGHLHRTMLNYLKKG